MALKGIASSVLGSVLGDYVDGSSSRAGWTLESFLLSALASHGFYAFSIIPTPF